jgi:hypothetical protein
MALLRLSTLFILLSFPLSALPAQLFLVPDTASIEGIWIGTLYQDEGGYADKFQFMLEIGPGQFANSGLSRVGIEDIQAAISFEAVKNADASWTFTEIEVINSRQPELVEWCFKGYRLSLKYASNGDLILSGRWWGKSSGGACVPGYIILRKSNGRV